MTEAAAEPRPFSPAFYAQNTPDKLAVVCDDVARTWPEHNDRICQAGHALGGLGVAKGQRMAMMLHNCIEWWEISGAAGKLKASTVPIGYRLKAPEVEYIINDCEAETVIHGPEFNDIMVTVQSKCERIPAERWICIGGEPIPGGTRYEDIMATAPTSDPEDESDETGGSIIYTSGTTGRPKGAYRKGGKRDPSFGLAVMDAFGFSSNDVHLVCCPLYHSAPPAFAGVAFLLGCTTCILPRFSPEAFCEAVQKHKISTSFMVPTQLNRLVAMPDEFYAQYDLSSLRSIAIGGAPCSQSTKERFLDLFGPCLYEFYGSTEGAINTIMKPEDHRRKPGSCGVAFPGTEIRILDSEGKEVPTGEEGELYVRNTMLVDEYYGNDEATKSAFRDGFLSVGDVARLDEDGFVYICDRKKDMIISGGVNIYPAEIERTLEDHPDILEAAVIGIPDKEWGESIKAIIQLRDGASMTEDALYAYCSDQMADYKKPRSVDFVDDLPRNPSGKLLKNELRDKYWEGHESNVL